MINNFGILNFKEEKMLSNKERLEYYNRLREFVLDRKYESLTAGSLSICSIINPAVREILKNFCGYDIEIRNNEYLENLVGIYAYTHQSKYDHVNLIASNPNHTIILNSSVLSKFYKMILSINGVIYVDKEDKASRITAKLDMMKLLLENRSVTIFPESAWNLSPNKLHLPFYIGIVDLAKATKKPIIPIVCEYYYNTKKMDGIERIEKVVVEFGNPIYVREEDDSLEKLEEYSEAISTIRWNLIEEKGQFSRNDVSNYEYINFLKGNVRNLKNAHVDVDVERRNIYGANGEFYLFNHINDVPYDANGNLLETLYVRKLIKLYNENIK